MDDADAAAARRLQEQLWAEEAIDLAGDDEDDDEGNDNDDDNEDADGGGNNNAGRAVENFVRQLLGKENSNLLFSGTDSLRIIMLTTSSHSLDEPGKPFLGIEFGLLHFFRSRKR